MSDSRFRDSLPPVFPSAVHSFGLLEMGVKFVEDAAQMTDNDGVSNSFDLALHPIPTVILQWADKSSCPPVCDLAKVAQLTSGLDSKVAFSRFEPTRLSLGGFDQSVDIVHQKFMLWMVRVYRRSPDPQRPRPNTNEENLVVYLEHDLAQDIFFTGHVFSASSSARCLAHPPSQHFQL